MGHNQPNRQQMFQFESPRVRNPTVSSFFNPRLSLLGSSQLFETVVRVRPSSAARHPVTPVTVDSPIPKSMKHKQPGFELHKSVEKFGFSRVFLKYTN